MDKKEQVVIEDVTIADSFPHALRIRRAVYERCLADIQKLIQALPAAADTLGKVEYTIDNASIRDDVEEFLDGRGYTVVQHGANLRIYIADPDGDHDTGKPS